MEIKWLNDVITNNISQLNNLIQLLNNTQISDIAIVSEQIDTNRQTIENNSGDIQLLNNTQISDIAMVSEQIDTNKRTIENNSRDIHTNYNLANKGITENKDSIRFSSSKQSNIISGSFSSTNLRVDDNKAFIVANENTIAENHDAIALNQNAITENHDAIALNQNAITENHDAIAEIQNTIVGYSTDMFIIKFKLLLRILGWRRLWENF